MNEEGDDAADLIELWRYRETDVKAKRRDQIFRIANGVLVVIECGIVLWCLLCGIYTFVLMLFDLPDDLAGLALSYPILMLVFAVTHSIHSSGFFVALIWLVLVLIGSWVLEDIGVASGVAPFGEYRFSDDILTVFVHHVPLTVPFWWYMMIYLSQAVSCSVVGAGLRHMRRTRAGAAQSILVAGFSGALLMGAALVLDPVGSIGAGIWEYTDSGNHLSLYMDSIPWMAFMGYLTMGTIFSGLYFLIEAALKRPKSNKSVLCALLPCLLWASYGFLLTVDALPGTVRVLSFVVFLLLGIVAAIRVLLSPRVPILRAVIPPSVQITEIEALSSSPEDI